MMELATDIMAILGWAMIGFCLPTHIAIFRDGASVFGNDSAQLTYWIFNSLSFGLIAASIVVG